MRIVLMLEIHDNVSVDENDGVNEANVS